MPSPNDFNAQIIEEFHTNDGVVGGPFEGATLLLLHHTGAKSAKRYVTPLVYRRDGDRYVIFASKAGAPTNPDWYHNLLAHPNVSIEVGTETLPALATDAEGEQRDALYAAQASDSPQFAEYEKSAEGRTIPVVILTPAR
jgi:deazaflavin-dependent oxidoreductase (nitroreductase family)